MKTSFRADLSQGSGSAVSEVLDRLVKCHFAANPDINMST